MRLIKNTTELIGIKNPNIIISLVFENGYSYRGSSKTGLSCIRNYFLKYPLESPTTGTSLSRWTCQDLICH